MNEPVAGESAAPVTLPLRFVGSGSEYFRIWIVNLLLTLVTLGLYYPFAKVRRLRYFHGATEVGGQPLAFHADPWKMFRGYVLVAVMFGAYSLAGHFSPTAGLIAFLIVAALWPALWHSSMRFRLANTSWRGLRLRYTGRRRQAYAVWALPAAAVVLIALLMITLFPAPTSEGLPPEPSTFVAVALAFGPMLVMMAVMPLFLWLFKRLQHNHYAYGGEEARFTVGPGAFYKLSLKAFGLMVLAGVGTGLLAAGLLGFFGAFSGEPGIGMVILFGIVGASAYVLLFSIGFGYWAARLQNLCWSGTRSQGLSFESTLKARALIGLWLRNALLVIVTLGLYFPFAQIASARLRLEAVTLRARRDPAEIAAAGGLADESAAGDAAGDLFGFDIGL